MFIGKIVALAAIALGASASIDAGNYDGSLSTKATITTAAPVVTSTTTPKRKCKKWSKKPEYVETAPADPVEEDKPADNELPQLIGNGGFQTPVELPGPVEEPPAPVDESPAPAPVDEPPAPVVEPPAPIDNLPGRVDEESLCNALKEVVSGPINYRASEATLKADFVARSNALRQTYGKIVGFDYSPYTVRYDQRIENIADVYASMRSTDKCDMKHSENEFRSSNGVGENLFWVNDPSGQPPTVFARNIEGLRSFVHKECSAFVREMNFGKGGFGGDTNAYGHLSQLLWGPSTNVGCATCVSGEDVLSICHYASPGNMGGSNILGERV